MNFYVNMFVIHLLCVIFVSFNVCTQIAYSQTNVQDSKYDSLYDEICEIVENNFYSTEKIESKFKVIKDVYKNHISSIPSEFEFSKIINKMLAELNASHTHYYKKNTPEFYQLASIFHILPIVKKQFDNKEIQYPSIGILTSEFDGKIFIVSVLTGSVAEKAGLLQGDEIVSADGKPFAIMRTFENKANRPVTLEIRRTQNGQLNKIQVTPGMINPSTEFLDAERESIQIIEVDSKKIGYIHIWSYAGEEYHQLFQEAISWGKLKSADALIWDLRDGWGGANPGYLNIFNKQIPTISQFNRDGSVRVFDPQWRKPVVMLVNGRTRSGKEILAYGFRKYKIGKIIGEKTSGATLAGKLFFVSDGSMLFLAVADSRIDDVNLEGVGVEPDLHIPMDIRYSEGKDIQLEKAGEYLEEVFKK